MTSRLWAAAAASITRSRHRRRAARVRGARSRGTLTTLAPRGAGERRQRKPAYAHAPTDAARAVVDWQRNLRREAEFAEMDRIAQEAIAGLKREIANLDERKRIVLAARLLAGE